MSAKKYIVRLSGSERVQLSKLVKTGKVAAHKRLRAQILLKADCSGPGKSLRDRDIADMLEINPRTVERTRQQLVEEGLEKALQRKPHSATNPRRLDGEQEAHLANVGSTTVLDFRGTWTLLEDGRVRQFFEQSADQGKSWQAWFEGFYKRKS